MLQLKASYCEMAVFKKQNKLFALMTIICTTNVNFNVSHALYCRDPPPAGIISGAHLLYRAIVLS